MRLWEIIGTGQYFDRFYVEADDIWLARAKASDILAGPTDPVTGRRAYNTVELEIRDVAPVDLELTG